MSVKSLSHRPLRVASVIVLGLALSVGVTSATASSPDDQRVPNGSVTTKKIRNGAVTTPKLHRRAVTTPKLRWRAVSTPKLRRGAVISGKIRNGTIRRLDLIRPIRRDLRHRVWVFRATSGSSTRGSMRFDLPDFPKGRYLATYEVFMDGASGTLSSPLNAACYFYRSGANVYAAFTSTTSVYDPAGLSGTGVLNKNAASWSLTCDADRFGEGSEEWSVYEPLPVRVTLTRIDRTIGGRLAPSATRTAPDAQLSR